MKAMVARQQKLERRRKRKAQLEESGMAGEESGAAGEESKAAGEESGAAGEESGAAGEEVEAARVVPRKLEELAVKLRYLTPQVHY